ncbi:MAG: glycosyltransferase family 4 protein [Desulfobacteraceae bacterium]|nr:glycosyltransferase family 4 protein [Desulfobacteraceae bacterium]
MKVLAVTNLSQAEAYQFQGFARSGVQTEVMCPPSSAYTEFLLENNIKVTPLKIKKHFDSKAIRSIRARLVNTNADILHVFNNKAVSNGLLASRGLPVKIIAYRGIVGNVSVFNPVSWATYLHPRVDRIVCVAEAVRQFFLNMSFAGWRFPSYKPVTIYKGHDLDWYREPRVDITQFGIPEDAFVVTTVANMRPRKGIQFFIEAMNNLPVQIAKKTHFLIVGKMDEKALRKSLNKLGQNTSRVHLTGFRKDAAAISGSSDVYVLPAIKREGLPKTVIEAMAYGVPPVVTNTGGSPELIEDGKSGIVIPPGDPGAIAGAVKILYENSEQRKKMGQEARKQLNEKFHVNQTIRETLALYREVVEYK